MDLRTTVDGSDSRKLAARSLGYWGAAFEAAVSGAACLGFIALFLLIVCIGLGVALQFMSTVGAPA